MEQNLLAQILPYIDKNVVEKAATYLGEESGNTENALKSAIPMILTGMVNAGSEEGGAARLLGLLGDHHIDAGTMTHTASLFSGGEHSLGVIALGKKLLAELFDGKKQTELSAVLANKVDFKPDNVAKLLALLAPFVFGFLAKLRTQNSLNAGSLVGLLLGQKNELAAAIPLAATDLLGLSQAHRENVAAEAVDGKIEESDKYAAAHASGNDILKWTLTLIGAGLAAFLLLTMVKGCQKSPNPNGVMAVNQAAKQAHIADSLAQIKAKHIADSLALVNANAAPKVEKIALPTGESLELTEGTINYQLSKFLADKNDQKLPRVFTFDHLNFVTAKTELTPESDKTVQDLVAILKAYPTCEVNLLGHTDNVGKPADNQKLSEQRATAIKNYLVKAGIDSKRIAKALGFGDTKPMVANDTDENKAKNRRLELEVIKK